MVWTWVVALAKQDELQQHRRAHSHHRGRLKGKQGVPAWPSGCQPPAVHEACAKVWQVQFFRGPGKGLTQSSIVQWQAKTTKHHLQAGKGSFPCGLMPLPPVPGRALCHVCLADPAAQLTGALHTAGSDLAAASWHGCHQRK